MECWRADVFAASAALVIAAGGCEERARSIDLASPPDGARAGLTAAVGAGADGAGADAPDGALAGAPAQGAAPLALSAPLMGINLSSVAFYSPEWVFVDVFKSSHAESSDFPWMFSRGSEVPAPPLDPDGYPVGLPSGQSVQTVCKRVRGHYPGGRYTILFEGEGEVEVDLDAERTRHAHDGRGTARFQARVTPSDKGILLRILRSSERDHVRNIRVIMPGFEATYETEPFHPLFVERLRSFGVLRFMDWGETNGSQLVRWDERKRPSHRTQYRGGVAYEYMLQLSNTLGQHPWICVPHLADDEFVRNLAALVRDGLDPNLTVFVELSNEVWNGIFGQHRDTVAAAERRGVPWHELYVARSLEVFRIFEEEFGDRARMVRVLGSHSERPSLSERILAAAPPGAVDALAIAPYFGGKLGNRSNWRTTREWTVEQVLAACREDLAAQREKIRHTRAHAKAAGVTLIAYEGGQHLAGVGEAMNDERLVDLFIAANRHPGMGALYRDHLADWAAEGGGVFCAFNSVYLPQKYGSWGALEHQDQQLEHAPKYDALVETAARWLQAAKK